MLVRGPTKRPLISGGFVGFRQRPMENKNLSGVQFRGFPKYSAECSGTGCAAERDGRLLALKARFWRGWDLVDFLMYPIKHL